MPGTAICLWPCPLCYHFESPAYGRTMKSAFLRASSHHGNGGSERSIPCGCARSFADFSDRRTCREVRPAISTSNADSRKSLKYLYMKIILMGTPFSHGNRGVTALAASLVELFQRARGDVAIQFHLMHSPIGEVELRPGGIRKRFPVICCRMSPKAAFTEQIGGILLLSIAYRVFPSLRRRITAGCEWIREIESADLVGDIRGGDSFSDIYGLKRLLLGSLPVLSVIMVRGSIVQLPQTFGPFKSIIARCMAGYLLRRSITIVARDVESRAVAQKLVRRGEVVDLCPDVAFALFPMMPVLSGDGPCGIVGKGSPGAACVGLNINALMYQGGYSKCDMFGLKLDYPRFVQSLIRAFLSRTNCRLVMIPHTYAVPGDIESDNGICREVWDGLSPEEQERIMVIEDEYDQHEIKGLIGSCDFFVGSRMHSCIAALSQGVPCVGVAYSMKFRGVFASVGMGDWVIDCREAAEVPAVERVLELFERRDEIRAPLSEAADKARRELGEIFRGLLLPSRCAEAPRTALEIGRNCET